MFAFSLLGLGLSLWMPSANVNEQIIRISFFVRSAMLSVALSLIIGLLRAMLANAEIATGQIPCLPST
jgi:hypothetical protein